MSPIPDHYDWRISPEKLKKVLSFIWQHAFDLIFLAAFILLILFQFVQAIPGVSNIQDSLDLGNALSPPSLTHPMGTDNLGRDLLLRLSEVMTRTVIPLWIGVFCSLLVGIICAFIFIHCIGHRLLGVAEKIFFFLTSFVASIPISVICFGVAVVIERSNLFSVLLPLVVLFGMQTYHTITNFYRRDQRLGFWVAHQTMGGSLAGRILRYGILRSWRQDILSLLSFQLKVAISIEASLSYLGFGIQEPDPSFGNMLASHFDLYLKGEWSILLFIILIFILTSAVPVSITRIFRLTHG